MRKLNLNLLLVSAFVIGLLSWELAIPAVTARAATDAVYSFDLAPRQHGCIPGRRDDGRAWRLDPRQGIRDV